MSLTPYSMVSLGVLTWDAQIQGPTSILAEQGFEPGFPISQVSALTTGQLAVQGLAVWFPPPTTTKK